MEFIQKYNKVDKNNISIDSFNEVEVRGLTLSNEVLIDNSFLDQSLSGYDILQNVTRSKEDTKKDAFPSLTLTIWKTMLLMQKLPDGFSSGCQSYPCQTHHTQTQRYQSRRLME